MQAVCWKIGSILIHVHVDKKKKKLLVSVKDNVKSEHVFSQINKTFIRNTFRILAFILANTADEEAGLTPLASQKAKWSGIHPSLFFIFF